MKELLVFAFFLYFPYGWCALSGNSRESFGLIWKADRHALRDVAAVSLLTLLPLTAVSLFFFGDRLFPPALRSV
ncbi:MAG TPA: SYNERG-CTERM system CAAX-type protease, partial [Aminivibrio sp.]|nr:SYNERG-CTERM system CAAX-type protease [Aminivibrio sp.]